MDAELRARFNAGWTPELARRVREDLKRRLGSALPFPIAETPLFLGEELRERFVGAADGIMEQLVSPGFIAEAQADVPEEFRGPGVGRLPQLAVIDFAVVRDADGNLAPRVVELQAFPSLYAFQIALADVWATHLATMPGMPTSWRLFFSGMDRYRALGILRETLVGDHDPEEVCLLDYDPENQKTIPDFAATRHWFGIDPICITDLVREGRKLYRVKEGRTIPVRRIYHRVVFDELEQTDITLPFDLREEIDVEWVPHPAWWFLWSKASMLRLDHPAVPRTVRISELQEIPDDLDRWVLKPLYSFAGGGVNVEPTRADVEAVPESERSNWVLQEMVDYTEAFRSAEGFGVKVEIRMMYVRPDAADEMTLLLNLVRLSRGKMMGVDYNKDLTWTGASVGVFPSP
ncbi:MAG: ATP-grasp domain-containing protein [Planctomycetota bacterium]|jgi:hypothetical protein